MGDGCKLVLFGQAIPFFVILIWKSLYFICMNIKREVPDFCIFPGKNSKILPIFGYSLSSITQWLVRDFVSQGGRGNPRLMLLRNYLIQIAYEPEE